MLFEVVQSKDVKELKDIKTKTPHITRRKDRFKSPKVGARSRIKVRFEIIGNNRWYTGKVTKKASGVTSVKFIDGIQEFKGARPGHFLKNLTKVFGNMYEN